MAAQSRPLVKYGALLGAAGTLAYGYQFVMNKNTHKSSWKEHKDKTEHSSAFFNVTDAVRSALLVVKDPHARTLVAVTVVLTYLTRRILGPFLPVKLRKRALVPSFIITIWAVYYRIYVIEKPLVRFHATFWNTQIVEKLRRKAFAPVFWAFNTHMQTALCNALNSLDSVVYPAHTYRREAVPAFDGNEILLDWAIPANKRDFLLPDSPIVVLSHGIMGNAEDNYMRNMASLCMRRGWRVVAMFRWRIDAYETRDFKMMLDHVHRRYPDAPMFAIGFSAGANILLSYLTATGDDTPLTAAVGISTAWSFPDVMHHVSQSSNKSYSFALHYAMQQCVLRHIAHDKFLKPEDYEDVLKKWWDSNDGHALFDHFLSCLPYYSGKGEKGPRDPLGAKFGNPTDAYYRKGCPGKLNNVAISILLIHGMDDPIGTAFTSKCLQEAIDCKNFIVATTKRGGHIGWHEGLFPTGPAWCDKLATNFVSSVLSAYAQTNSILDVVKRTLIDRPGGAPAGPIAEEEGWSARLVRAVSHSNIRGVSENVYSEEDYYNDENQDD